MTFDKNTSENSLFPIAFCAFSLYNVRDYGGEVVALAEVIGLVSGKGGMGKTALCAELAKSLAAAGQKVLCIDCCDVFGDLDDYLQLEPIPHLTYAEVCRGAFPLEKATHHPQLPKLAFLAAPATTQKVSAEEFAALLRRARLEFDYILLDDPRDEMAADRYILVTAALPTAIRGARRRADALEVQGKRNVRLVVNQIDRKQMQLLRLTVDDVMDQVGLPLLGVVPHDPETVLACARERKSFSIRKSGVETACERIASRIQGMNTAIPSRL